jgi:hypothetical protein
VQYSRLVLSGVVTPRHLWFTQTAEFYKDLVAADKGTVFS